MSIYNMNFQRFVAVLEHESWFGYGSQKAKMLWFFFYTGA